MAVPMKSKKGQEHTKAYRECHNILVKRGLRPKLQRLDNEASALLTDFMTAKQVAFQLTPAGNHQRNAAEKAIRM